MVESKFPTTCTFTGFSGCPVYLVQERKTVADVMAITWVEQPDKGVFAGSLVLFNAQTNANPELPLDVEVGITTEDYELKVVRLEDIEFVETVVKEQAVKFIAKRVVLEEYHQLPLEEEI